MKLPRGAMAIVDSRKIREYCLSKEHPQGKHKARVFEAALGITAEDTDELVNALKRAAIREDAALGVSDFYGNRYIIDFEFSHGSKTATIRSCWIVLLGKAEPSFVTCYVL